MDDQELETYIKQIGTELGLKEPAVIKLPAAHGVTFSWYDNKDQRRSFEIHWVKFRSDYGSGYDHLPAHVQREVARIQQA